MIVVDSVELAKRAALIRDRISQAGGDTNFVRVMAVTKGFGPEVVLSALRAGCDLLGESYVQEVVAKFGEIPRELRTQPEWHFIGRLQRNKVRSLPDEIDVIQSIDRRSLAIEVGRRRPGQRVLVQVNISGEERKGGCQKSEVRDLVAFCIDEGLVVEGLMGVGSQSAAAIVTAEFSALRRLVDEVGLRECSMGMTDDLELAVGAGSTMIRVGSAMFGPRPQR